MAVPIMAGASLVSVFEKLGYAFNGLFRVYVVGFISSFVFALLSIKFFLALISKVKLMPFAIYRLVLAAILSVIIFM
ncbi:Undecaprenyl-diphosphatase OS=Lysinibacillus sphaericus OX=1421 GN=uppP PE=3 SV=1 [Lysinibacillus sphaericus]